jgi:muconolactone delta-isomerase
MQAILRSLPMDPWMTVETVPLSQHPSDPAALPGRSGPLRTGEPSD